MIIGLCSTAAVVATAWSQFGRSDELEQSYSAATLDLSMARVSILAAEDEDTFAEQVTQAESAVAHAHAGWLTNRSGKA